jgi:hypothetical protein
MAYLTAEEIYCLVIASSAPAELRPGFDNDVRALRRIGHFSEGAQQILHRMQIDSVFLGTLISDPSSVVEDLQAFITARLRIPPADDGWVDSPIGNSI